MSCISFQQGNWVPAVRARGGRESPGLAPRTRALRPLGKSLHMVETHNIQRGKCLIRIPPFPHDLGEKEKERERKSPNRAAVMGFRCWPPRAPRRPADQGGKLPVSLTWPGILSAGPSPRVRLARAVSLARRLFPLAPAPQESRCVNESLCPAHAVLTFHVRDTRRRRGSARLTGGHLDPKAARGLAEISPDTSEPNSRRADTATRPHPPAWIYMGYMESIIYICINGPKWGV